MERSDKGVVETIYGCMGSPLQCLCIFWSRHTTLLKKPLRSKLSHYTLFEKSTCWGSLRSTSFLNLSTCQDFLFFSLNKSTRQDEGICVLPSRLFLFVVSTCGVGWWRMRARRWSKFVGPPLKQDAATMVYRLICYIQISVSLLSANRKKNIGI